MRGFSGTTAADGSFGFSFPAPAMFGIRYRVVGKGGTVTPPVSFNAKGQDLTMWVAGLDPTSPGDTGQAIAGVPFTIAVDTTPSLVRRPETIGLPVFAGRTLTLQRRVDGDTLGDARHVDGPARRDGLLPGRDRGRRHGRLPGPPGGRHVRGQPDRLDADLPDVRHRPRPEPGAGRARRTPVQPAGRQQAVRTRTTTSRPAARRGAGAASATASSRYGWYPTLWDYSWESGQSLTSPPDLGSVRSGWWLDYADGAGRVSRQNGGLYLDSQRNNGGGPGDFGTTRATLEDAGRAYGRWEARLRLKSAEATAADFTVLVELVPERPEDYACGRRNIILAQVAAHSSTMTFGAKADTRQWTGTRRIPSLIHTSPAVAVEVAKGHITWFWDGKPIGTVKGKRRGLRRTHDAALQHGGRPRRPSTTRPASCRTGSAGSRSTGASRSSPGRSCARAS